MSDEKGLFSFENRSDYYPWIAILLIGAATTFTLSLLGRNWWCEAADYTPWAWNIWSRHNSQHLLDPYSFTHMLHGVLEFWLIGLVFRRMPLAWRFALAILIESGWEVMENTNYMINRYREETISLDYFGDSIINSVADIVFCAFGFFAAWKLRFWRSAALFVATEAVLLLTIRDSLILNLIMLVYPLESIKTWQMP
jgi:hypothetical protein